MKVEIDSGSGFCFGVTTAIEKAEEELSESGSLFCLGDIVHNGMECDRLAALGLVTIDHERMKELHGAKVLLRAHGEPPSTYHLALQNNIELIDATCPVVLALQRRIRRQFEECPDGQIVIFGKLGHAEVLGLVGQTEGKAIVVEHYEDLVKMCEDGTITLGDNDSLYLFSQTTKSLSEFHKVTEYIQQHISPKATFKSYDTICRRVANRMPNSSEFAARHDLVLFVCGRKSSNGRVLFEECKKANANTYLIEGPEEIDASWLKGIESIGICGATSTPKWLMEQCKERIDSIVC